MCCLFCSFLFNVGSWNKCIGHLQPKVNLNSIAPSEKDRRIGVKLTKTEETITGFFFAGSCITYSGISVFLFKTLLKKLSTLDIGKQIRI